MKPWELKNQSYETMGIKKSQSYETMGIKKVNPMKPWE